MMPSMLPADKYEKHEKDEIPKISEDEILAKMPPSSILRLGNMTCEEELADDALYDELISDIAQEMNMHGTVKTLVVPRAGEGKGLVFVQYTSIEGAVKAKPEVHDRAFGNSGYVTASFYPEDLFLHNTLVIPDGYVFKPPAINEDLD